MWPWLRDGFKAFFSDKAFFAAKFDKQVGRIRGLILTAGIAATMYADQLATAINRPDWTEHIKVGSIVLAGLSVMLRAGDKTPAEVKEFVAAQAKQP